jgi:hypothetical protein
MKYPTVLLLALTISARAQQLGWFKPDSTDQEYQQTRQACEQQSKALIPDLAATDAADRKVLFQQCMQDAGFELVSR